LRRLALLLEYDGTAYGGSQHQKNAPTVQGALESALSSLTGEQIRITLAGRTDAGVHAVGQVAAFNTASRHSARVVLRGTNAGLPRDIAVRAACEVPLNFNPRRHARSRRYRYTLHAGAQRSALLRDRAWHVNPALDLDGMRKAAESLQGVHDFAAFTRPSEVQKGSTLRCITDTEISRGSRGLAYVDIEGNAFLRNMVRRIVGSLVEVGRGLYSIEEFERLISEAQPGAAKMLAPARGLCLMKVRYESGLFDDETDEDI
jgi:tRNA pseudouridine38-40 synthase